MVRQAYTLREDDDDFGQAGSLVREVWDDAQREAFTETVAGHLLGGVKSRCSSAPSTTGSSVDAETGKQIEELVRAGLGGANPGGDADDAKVVNGPDRRDEHERRPLTRLFASRDKQRYAVCPRQAHGIPLVRGGAATSPRRG